MFSNNFNKLSPEQRAAIRRRKREIKLDYQERLSLVARTVGTNDGQFRLNARTVKLDEERFRYQAELDRRYP